MAKLQFLKSAVPNQRKAVEVAKDTSDGEAGDASAPGASKKERTKVGAVDRVKTPADLHFGCSATSWQSRRTHISSANAFGLDAGHMALRPYVNEPLSLTVGAAVSCPAGAARRVAADDGRQGDEGLALAQVAGAAQARGRPGEHSGFR